MASGAIWSGLTPAMNGDRIALAAANPAALARAAQMLETRGAMVLACCANLAELRGALRAAPPDFALVDAALGPDRETRAALAADLGLPVLPLAWLGTEVVNGAEDGQRYPARAEDLAPASRHVSDAETQARVQAVAQRNALVREVHHRIKNNLQAVVGILRRQLGAHPELAGPLETAISQVNTMAIVHGVQGRLPNEAVRLIDLLAGIGVAAENAVDRAVVLPPLAGLSDLELAVEETVPIAMVLNELLLNALRHGRVGPSVVPVQMRVARFDQGVTVQIENAFEDSGGPLAQPEQSAGGMKLVQALLPVHGATLSWLRTEPGVMVAELVLSPPVLQYHGNRNFGSD